MHINEVVEMLNDLKFEQSEAIDKLIVKLQMEHDREMNKAHQSELDLAMQSIVSVTKQMGGK